MADSHSSEQQEHTNALSLPDSSHTHSRCPVPASCNICPSLAQVEAKILVAHKYVIELSKERQSLMSSINASHRPLMYHFPNEILCEIFQLCCQDSLPLSNKPPISLSAVSQHWRDVALTTRRLWSTVVIHAQSGRPYDVKTAAAWMLRSGSLPLSLHIKFTEGSSGSPENGPTFPPLIQLLRSHSGRWKNLTIEEFCKPSLLLPLFADLETVTVPNLAIRNFCHGGEDYTGDGLLLPNALPAVKGSSTIKLQFSLKGLTSLVICESLYVGELVHIIQRACHLVSCSITAGTQGKVLHVPSKLVPADEPVVSNSLTFLHTKTPKFPTASNILNFLTLPHLDTLHYEYHSRSPMHPDFVIVNDFLRRSHSSSRLNNFVFSITPMQLMSMSTWCVNLPVGITSLKLDTSWLVNARIEKDVMDEFFCLLAGALNDGKLPKLRQLLLDVLKSCNVPPCVDIFQRHALRVKARIQSSSDDLSPTMQTLPPENPRKSVVIALSAIG